MYEEFENGLCSFGENLGRTFLTAKRLSRIAQGREAHPGNERRNTDINLEEVVQTSSVRFGELLRSSRTCMAVLLSQGAAQPWAILDNRFAVENRPTNLTQYPFGWLREYYLSPYSFPVSLMELIRVHLRSFAVFFVLLSGPLW